MGPWFEGTMTGGVFLNWASVNRVQYRLTRSPAAAPTKGASGLGAVVVWVNGVAIFNNLDGGSYSNAAGTDQGGGGVSALEVTDFQYFSPTRKHSDTLSLEGSHDPSPSCERSILLLTQSHNIQP